MKKTHNTQLKGTGLLATILLFGLISSSTLSFLEILKTHLHLQNDFINFRYVQLTAESVAYAYENHSELIPHTTNEKQPQETQDNNKQYLYFLSPSKTKIYVSKTNTHIHVWAIYKLKVGHAKRPLPTPLP